VIPCATGALGDWVTGPNHILPTAGAARHLARLEGLETHGASLALRVRGHAL